jgi:hypothetical protein
VLNSEVQDSQMLLEADLPESMVRRLGLAPTKDSFAI